MLNSLAGPAWIRWDTRYSFTEKWASFTVTNASSSDSDAVSVSLSFDSEDDVTKPDKMVKIAFESRKRSSGSKAISDCGSMTAASASSSILRGRFENVSH